MVTFKSAIGSPFFMAVTFSVTNILMYSLTQAIWLVYFNACLNVCCFTRFPLVMAVAILLLVRCILFCSSWWYWQVFRTADLFNVK